MANYSLKPVPGDSIEKHLRMLESYCTAQAASDKSPKRKVLLQDLARKLNLLRSSRTVTELRYYGE